MHAFRCELHLETCRLADQDACHGILVNRYFEILTNHYFSATRFVLHEVKRSASGLHTFGEKGETS